MSRTPSPKSTASSWSSYNDDSSEIDELDNRSRQINKLLRKNINKANVRKKLLDVVRDKAWILEDQVSLLEKQTRIVKQAMKRKSFMRRVVMFTALVSSVILVGLGINYVVHPSGSDNN